MLLRRSPRHMRETVRMQDAFGYVLFATVILGGLGAIVTACLAGGAYREIGKGGFYSGDDAAGGRPARRGARAGGGRPGRTPPTATTRPARCSPPATRGARPPGARRSTSRPSWHG